MTQRFLHIVPGLLGAVATLAIYFQLNLADWPREYEAGVAIVLALVIFALARWCVAQIVREESRAEAMLAQAGIEPDQTALRAAKLVAQARTRLSAMQSAGRQRKPELQDALTDLNKRLEALFADMLHNPQTVRRADDLLRRSLPRVDAAFLDYCRFAERGNGVVDTDETRARLIAALGDTGNAADRAREDLIMATGEDADVSLRVLEGTLARSR